MVDVGRLEEAQLVPAEVEHLSVGEALDLALVVPPRQAEADRHSAADQGRLGGPCGKAIHTAALVTLEVQERDVGEARRVEHLADCAAHAVVHLEVTRVQQRWALVVDEELVEPQLELGDEGRYPIDTVDDLVDARRGHLWRAHGVSPLVSPAQPASEKILGRAA